MPHVLVAIADERSADALDARRAVRGIVGGGAPGGVLRVEAVQLRARRTGACTASSRAFMPMRSCTYFTELPWAAMSRTNAAMSG